MTILFSNAADMQERLGRIPLDRIRMTPPPGHATEEDVLRIRDREGVLCELVDGVLVEKPMGWYEARLAAALIYFLERFLDDHDLGIVLAPDGFLRILPSQVRAPDISFIAWEQFPGRRLPRRKVPPIAPDLAIEILSEGNTEEEMERKLTEYFAGGSRIVWIIDPETATARSYSSTTESTEIAADGRLDGAAVLPGFELRLEALFARAGRREL